MKFIPAITVSLFIGLISVGVSAQESGDQSQKKDRQKRGAAERKQLDRNRQQRGSRRAGNRNRRPDPMAIFARLDRNNDQKLTAEEIPQRLQQRFQMIDGDADGAVSKREFAAAMKQRLQGQRSGRGNGKRDPSKAREKGQRDGASRMAENPDAIIQRFDQNGDGKISDSEAPERLQEKFAKIDSNGDQSIDQQELTAAIQKRKDAGSRYESDPEKTKSQQPKRPPRGG